MPVALESGLVAFLKERNLEKRFEVTVGAHSFLGGKVESYKDSASSPTQPDIVMVSSFPLISPAITALDHHPVLLSLVSFTPLPPPPLPIGLS